MIAESDNKSLTIEGFGDWELPSRKDEEWKYTNLTPLSRYTYQKGILPQEINEKAIIDHYDKDEINIVIINGLFSEKFSNLDNVPKGINITTLTQSNGKNYNHFNKLFAKNGIRHKTPFVTLNQNISSEGVSIEVEEGTVSNILINILHVSQNNGEPMFWAPHILITMWPSSEVTILESHITLNAENVYFSNPLTDILLNENAVLHYYKAQKESLKAFHVGHIRVWQEQLSTFDSFTATFEGEITRNNLDIIIDGEDCHTFINGLYSLYGKQHADNHTSIDHRKPNCTSRQIYKGILNDASRAVFNGKILVRPEAQKTDSQQMNKNLLLGKDCRIDTKPQLEIFADDVKCTHGATIGQINEDELFYLQSRGFAKDTAKKLLCRGFADDLLNFINHKNVVQKLNCLVGNCCLENCASLFH